MTRSGVLSLIGVVLSGALALAIQYKSSSDAATEKTSAAKETLTIVRNTAGTLEKVERLLNPLDDPKLTIIFALPCSDKHLRKFCGSGKRQDARHRPDWKFWPRSLHPFARQKFSKGVLVSVTVFTNSKDADAFQSGQRGLEAPLRFDFGAGVGSDNMQAVVGGVNKLAINGKPYMRGDGSIFSTREFRHATIFVEQISDVENLEPKEFMITTHSGVSIKADEFRLVRVQGRTYYRHDFRDSE